jgi:predicted phage tail protein
MLQQIHLHGTLGQRFGRRHQLDVRTPAEAVLALSVLKPGFAETIRDGTWRVVRGQLKGGRRLGEDELGINLGGEMHILAAPRGSKGRGAGTAKMVIGVALIAAVMISTGGAGGIALAGTEAVVGSATTLGGAAFNSAAAWSLGISGTQVALFGAGLAFAGVSMLLSPQPRGSNSQAQDVKASHLFSGVLNSPDQGVPVPLAFGRHRVGGIPISISIETEDVAT